MAWADAQPGALKNVEEADGAPSCFGYKLIVSNATLTDNADGTCTVTTGGGGGNSFETIAVPAGASVVAESSTDTLTLTSTGSTLTLTGTAATDTINAEAVDVTCTDCLGVTEIADSYVLNTTDSMSGALTVGGLLTGSANLTVGNGLSAGTVTFLEGSGGGTNFKAFASPAAITADTTCTFENDANFIPDSCVGNGVDDGGSETNSLEVLTTGIASTEIPIGTAADTVVYAALSGQATMTNGGVVTVSDMTCTDCIGDTEITTHAGTSLAADLEEEVTEGSLADSTIVSADIKNATVAAADLASGALAPQTIWIPCAALMPLEAADSIPPLSKDAGTNVDLLPCAFDADADEGRTATFMVPSRVEAGSTITFRVFWYSAAATTGDAVWDIRHNSGTAADIDPDVALTTLAATDTTAGTAGMVSQTSITVSQTTAAWAANDLVVLVVERDANNAADTLAGDALCLGISIEMPLL